MGPELGGGGRGGEEEGRGWRDWRARNVGRGEKMRGVWKGTSSVGESVYLATSPRQQCTELDRGLWKELVRKGKGG